MISIQSTARLIISYTLSLCLVISLLLVGLSSCTDDEPKAKYVDNTVYESVTIGTQVWMVKNLSVTHYRNGDPIPDLTEAAEFYATTTGAYSNDYEGTNSNGRLYNWYAVNDPRGLAPQGWHIPSDTEWEILINFLGGEAIAGSKLKEIGTEHWCAPNSDATNESGFTALPADWKVDVGFATGCTDAVLWSADQFDADNANRIWIFNDNGTVFRYYSDKNLGISVRCIKD